MTIHFLPTGEKDISKVFQMSVQFEELDTPDEDQQISQLSPCPQQVASDRGEHLWNTGGWELPEGAYAKWSAYS